MQKHCRRKATSQIKNTKVVITHITHTPSGNNQLFVDFCLCVIQTWVCVYQCKHLECMCECMCLDTFEHTNACVGCSCEFLWSEYECVTKISCTVSVLAGWSSQQKSETFPDSVHLCVRVWKRKRKWEGESKRERYLAWHTMKLLKKCSQLSVFTNWKTNTAYVCWMYDCICACVLPSHQRVWDTSINPPVPSVVTQFSCTENQNRRRRRGRERRDGWRHGLREMSDYNNTAPSKMVSHSGLDSG